MLLSFLARVLGAYWFASLLNVLLVAALLPGQSVRAVWTEVTSTPDENDL